MSKEDRLQKAVAAYLDALGLFWFHSPNGGKRNAIEGAKFKAMGVKPGVPDILILNSTKQGHKGLAIELKIKPNKPTDNQREFMEKLIKNGWAVVVCYDIDEVINTIKQYYRK